MSRPLLVFYDGGEDFVLRKCSNRHALVKTNIYHILPGDFCGGPTNVGRERYIVSNERGHVGRPATWTRRLGDQNTLTILSMVSATMGD